MLYNKEHNFAYCPIQKVASSFWMLNMVQLDPELGPSYLRVPKEGHENFMLHKLATKKLGISLAKARNISSLLSFVVVRHPFERIASTYFNKIIDRGHLVGNLSSSRFYKISPQMLCPI